MRRLLSTVRKFGIARFFLYLLVVVVIPVFIVTVTLFTKPTTDALFVPVSDETFPYLVYTPADYADVANQVGSGIVLSGNGDSSAWLGSAESVDSYLAMRMSGYKLPAGAEIQSATLSLYSIQPQWVKVNVEIYTQAEVHLESFSESYLPSHQVLSKAYDTYSTDNKWNQDKYYVIDVTNSVKDYFTNINPEADAVTLIIKNKLGQPFGRKYFSTNIYNSAKVPMLTVRYTESSTKQPV